MDGQSHAMSRLGPASSVSPNPAFTILRGTHSTIMLDKGVPVHVVAKRIGDDPATLLRVYAKRTKKADTAAANVIGTLTKGVL